MSSDTMMIVVALAIAAILEIGLVAYLDAGLR